MASEAQSGPTGNQADNQTGGQFAGHVDGTWHPPGSARAHRARFARTPDGRLALTDLDADAPIEIEDGISISDRIAGAPRRVTFADRSVFVTRDDDALEALFGEKLRSSFFSRIARLERPSTRLFIFGGIMILAIVAAIRFGLPAAARAAAALTPVGINEQIGNGTLASLDRLMLDESTLDAARCKVFSDKLTRMAASIGLERNVKLACRKGTRVGANAFALPGGRIVVTDELITTAGNDNDVVAVLAHELAHAWNRHAEQKLWRAIGVGVALTVLFGDAGTLVEEMASAGTLILETSYTREHEREADLEAIDLLRSIGTDPGHLVTALEKLHKSCGDACAESGWLSSHPGGNERRAYLCAAIGSSEVADTICSQND